MISVFAENESLPIYSQIVDQEASGIATAVTGKCNFF
jgi:hypothetical protein